VYKQCFQSDSFKLPPGRRRLNVEGKVGEITSEGGL